MTDKKHPGGRPKKQDGGMYHSVYTEQLHIYVTPEMAEKVRRLASNAGLSESAYIRQLISKQGDRP